MDTDEPMEQTFGHKKKTSREFIVFFAFIIFCKKKWIHEEFLRHGMTPESVIVNNTWFMQITPFGQINTPIATILYRAFTSLSKNGPVIVEKYTQQIACAMESLENFHRIFVKFKACYRKKNFNCTK